MTGAHHSRLRQVDLALASGGGGTYRGYLGRPGTRPRFDRTTINEILEDIQHLEEDYAASLGESDRDDDESTKFRWEDDVLVVNGRAVRWREVSIRPHADGRFSLFSADDWVPIGDIWPTGEIDPFQLLRILASPSPARIALIDRIRRDVPTTVVIHAEQQGDPDAKEILVRVLADRREPEAAEVIAAELSNESASVRAEAAHALEHRGAGNWGPQLLEAAQNEQDDGVQELLIRAMSAAGYAPARPWLEQLIADPTADERVRSAARAAMRSITKGR